MAITLIEMNTNAILLGLKRNRRQCAVAASQAVIAIAYRPVTVNIVGRERLIFSFR